MFENRDICRKIIQEKSILSLFNMIAQEEEMMLSERAKGTINLQNNVIKQLSSVVINKDILYIVVKY